MTGRLIQGVAKAVSTVYKWTIQMNIQDDDTATEQIFKQTTNIVPKKSPYKCIHISLHSYQTYDMHLPIVSFVCDQISMSSTWRPWLGKRTSNVTSFPLHALKW